MAAGAHRYSEEDLRYSARWYLTPLGLKAAGIDIANATFAARQQALWGEGTTTVASDSTTSAPTTATSSPSGTPATGVGDPGVLVGRVRVDGHPQSHDQLFGLRGRAMIEGVMRHGTDMRVAGNYVDSHGQSEIGFGVTRLLGFDLLPGFKQINRVKLYRPDPGDRDDYRNLDAALNRPIRWT